MKQNTSHAVMAQRSEPLDSLDDFPTPPWATRALLEHVIDGQEFNYQSCWEPACGKGHMAKVLKEYFGEVIVSDIFPYGYGSTRGFLDEATVQEVDWIITNPPFNRAEKFAAKALSIATTGVAIFARSVFTESVGRHQRLFSRTPPTMIAQFAERVTLLQSRFDKKKSTATAYAWFVWQKSRRNARPEFAWIPASRKALERHDDYLNPLP